MVKLDHLGMCVADTRRSADFYVRNFGFAIEMPTQDPRAIHAASPSHTEATIRSSLASGSLRASRAVEPPGSDMIAIKDDADFTIFLGRDPERAALAACDLFLQVDDVEAKHRELSAAGVAFLKAPQKLFWGYGAELLDPDGYRVHVWDEKSMRERG